MRPYNVEIFRPDFTMVGSTNVNEVTYKEDYLDSDENTITVLALPGIKKQDFIRISRGREEYTGVVTEIRYGTDRSKRLQTISYKPLMELLNTDILFDVDAQGKGSLEEFICSRIRETFIENPDTLQNIHGLSVTHTSATNDWSLRITPSESGGHYNIVNLLDSVIVPAMQKYGVLVKAALDIQNREIHLTVGQVGDSVLIIEADLPNIIKKSVTIKQVSADVNKLILFDSTDYATTRTYYLHPDLGYDTHDRDRITPVVCELKAVQCEEGSSFEAAAIRAAHDKFSGLAYSNLIELTMANDDGLVRPEQIAFGQQVEIISDGVAYRSILTGRERGKNTKLVFGTIRLDLTKILRRSAMANNIVLKTYKGDFVTCKTAPGWVTLCCTPQVVTAATEPVEYAGIVKVGDQLTDGTCVFTARDVLGEIDALKDRFNEAETNITKLEGDIEELREELGLKAEENQPVGTIKYSAADLGPNWLKCDGSFVSADDYPELVAVLGKNVPTGEQFKLLSQGDIPVQISNGVVYAGKLWVYSYSERKLYGVDVAGDKPVQVVSLTSTNAFFSDFKSPSTAKPIALSIVPHVLGTGAKLFLSQIIGDGRDTSIPEEYSWSKYFLIFEADFTGNESHLTMEPPFTSIERMSGVVSSKTYYYYPTFSASKCVPYVTSKIEAGVETYYCAIGERYYSYGSSSEGSLKWTSKHNVADLIYSAISMDTAVFKNQRVAYSSKHQGEIVSIVASSGNRSYSIHSAPDNTFEAPSRTYASKTITARSLVGPLNVVGEDRVIATFDKLNIPWGAISEAKIDNIVPKVSLPSAAKVFVDAGTYLWSKHIYLIFVGTGLLFSSDLSETSFGYLDTTSVMGAIVQYGSLTCAEDESELYLMGQDSSNRIVVSKITLNRLFDYANDGAWLPMLVSDGVPAYIKARTT